MKSSPGGSEEQGSSSSGQTCTSASSWMPELCDCLFGLPHDSGAETHWKRSWGRQVSVILCVSLSCVCRVCLCLSSSVLSSLCLLCRESMLRRRARPSSSSTWVRRATRRTDRRNAVIVRITFRLGSRRSGIIHLMMVCMDTKCAFLCGKLRRSVCVCIELVHEWDTLCVAKMDRTLSDPASST